MKAVEQVDVKPVDASNNPPKFEAAKGKPKDSTKDFSDWQIVRCRFLIWQEKMTWRTKQKREKPRYTDIAIVFLTIGIVALAYMQYRAMDAANEQTRIALHISERAYLSLGAPQMDASKTIAMLPLINTGHMPTGAVSILVHEATLPIVAGSNRVDFAAAEERHGESNSTQAAATGNPYNFSFKIPAFSEEKIEAGQQVVFIAGHIGYDDGFYDDGYQVSPYCMETVFQAVTKQILWSPCDAGVIVPLMEAQDHYEEQSYPDILRGPN